MKRIIFSALRSWKEQAARKPLLIRGARQVGKTWVVRELGKLFRNFVEVNFELYPEAKKIFHLNLDPARLIRDLALLLGKRIVPGETLIFFDEIQEEPKAIQALRYFYELLPAQHVLAAGSLLDFELEKTGMPVGRVSSLYMYPLSFIEFLAAQNEALLIEMIVERKDETPVSAPVHQKLLYLSLSFSILRWRSLFWGLIRLPGCSSLMPLLSTGVKSLKLLWASRFWPIPLSI